MARDKRARADAGDQVEDPALQSEVRAFAASLGLDGGGGAGGGGGFAFDDFAPPPAAAAPKSKKDKEAREAKPEVKKDRKESRGGDKEERRSLSKDDRKQERQQKPPPPPPAAAAPATPARDPIRERGWNSGAGPRPASLSFGGGADGRLPGPPARSVLPKDDPAVWHEAALPPLTPPPAAAAALWRAASSGAGGGSAAALDPDDPSLDAKKRKELRRLERRRLKQQQQRENGGGGPAGADSAAALPAVLTLDADTTERLRQRADALLEAEAAAYEQALGRRSAGDARWLQQVRKSGTTADRVAAMTLLVQVRIFSLFFWCVFLHAGGGEGGTTRRRQRLQPQKALTLSLGAPPVLLRKPRGLKAPREFIRADITRGAWPGLSVAWPQGARRGGICFPSRRRRRRRPGVWPPQTQQHNAILVRPSGSLTNIPASLPPQTQNKHPNNRSRPSPTCARSTA